MMRSSAVRATRAVLPIARTAIQAQRCYSIAATVRPRLALPAGRLSVAARVQGLRMYSAGGGLKKEEVEGRIMSLLQGFDKVSLGLVGTSWLPVLLLLGYAGRVV